MLILHAVFNRIKVLRLSRKVVSNDIYTESNSHELDRFYLFFLCIVYLTRDCSDAIFNHTI